MYSYPGRSKITVNGCIAFAAGMCLLAMSMWLMLGQLPRGHWQGPVIAFRYIVMAAAIHYAWTRCDRSVQEEGGVTVTSIRAVVLVALATLMAYIAGAGGEQDGEVTAETISQFVRLRNASSIGLALTVACAFGIVMGHFNLTKKDSTRQPREG